MLPAGLRHGSLLLFFKNASSLAKISFSPLYRYLLPHQMTGVRLVVPIGDRTTFNFGITNDLNANGFGDSVLPSFQSEMQIRLGDESLTRSLRLSTAFGPEIDSAVSRIVGSQNAHWDFLSDAWMK